jgi:hypothetical protein
MHIYIDKYDYLVNSLNNEDIDEEIDCINEKLKEIEQSNLFYFRTFKEKMLKENSIHKLDLDSDKITQGRFENMTNQIYNLQMKQFAESISNIKKDVKKNKYILLFDSSENIEPLTLEESEYKALLKFRDPLNSISVYDLFQEKIHSYYNSSSNGAGHGHSSKEGKKRGRPSIKQKKQEEEVQIAKVVNIDYDFCHHCKQRKPSEVMVRCNSSSVKGIEKPMKSYCINNTTVVRKATNFIITNYSGDPKEILDGYLNKKCTIACKRAFCHFCLKGSYDQIIEQIKDKKDWVCPWCIGNCFCSRCIRYDQILKLIAFYISYDGDMNILYDNLITMNVIIDKLSVNLLCSNIIIIKNEPLNKNGNLSRLIQTFNGKKDYDSIEEIIDQTYLYRDHIQQLKDYFDLVFTKAKQQKLLLNVDKKMTDICIENYDKHHSNNLLGKKKKREVDSSKESKDELFLSVLLSIYNNLNSIVNSKLL